MAVNAKNKKCSESKQKTAEKRFTDSAKKQRGGEHPRVKAAFKSKHSESRRILGERGEV